MRFAYKLTGLMFLGVLSFCGCTRMTPIPQMETMGGIQIEKDSVLGAHYYVDVRNYTGIGFDMNEQQQRYEIAKTYVGATCRLPSVVGERVIDEGTTYFLTNNSRRTYVIEIKCGPN